ncbi:MAG TPA: D-sedoheptulose 7-phosphate isomerase [Bacteroidales bacterium]|nr:D-sedoheptulose 7-phosphate isomerase [Bacteroidales bacterium]
MIKDQIRQSLDIKQKLLESVPAIEAIEKSSLAIIAAYLNKKKLLLAGNGGSAADAQHIAAELVNRFGFDRPGLNAIALTTDTSIITSVGNDSGFEQVFARQANALGSEGDIFIALSTSGNSANLIEALKICRAKKILTIGLIGETGGKMAGLCDICIRVPSGDTPRIQEVHILIGHIICSIVEEELFGSYKSPK